MSVWFLADENFNNRIVLGLRRHDETIDIALVQEVGLCTADDPTVLAWAADADRVLLTHDIATIPGYAHERVSAGLPMPGVLVVRSAMPIASVIEEVRRCPTEPESPLRG